MPLFSTTISNGTCHTDARFMLSYTSPWPSVPSPIIAATRAPRAIFLRASASPALIPVMPALHTVAVEVLPRQMLAAAVTAANTGFASHDLGDQAEKVARISQKVTVVAMVRQHGVLGVVQRTHHRDGRDLLAQAGVRGTRDESTRELIENELLGQTNQVAVGVQTLRIQADARPAVVVACEPGNGQRAGSRRRMEIRLNGLGNRHDGLVEGTEANRSENLNYTCGRLAIPFFRMRVGPFSRATSLPTTMRVRNAEADKFVQPTQY